jgi:hypothetical protein
MTAPRPKVTTLQVLQAYADAWTGPRDERVWPEVHLMNRTGQCEKVCCRAMERACRSGLIEYGVTMRSGWLTDKGKALLAAGG